MQARVRGEVHQGDPAQLRGEHKHDWGIIILFVQVSQGHENLWKSNYLPQKVHKSFTCNEPSVEWTLVYLNFAIVNDF